jgi:hypothetical protein
MAGGRTRRLPLYRVPLRGVKMANHKKQVCLRGHDTKVVGRNRHNRCKTCANEASLKRYHADPEGWNAYNRRWTALNPRKIQDSRLGRAYGITLADKERIFATQNGMCVICPFKFKDVYSAHTDHNHATGKVRGLLCDTCNRKVLPVLEKYADRIEAAKRYLEAA